MLGFRARIATIAVSVAVALTSFTPSFAMQMPAAPVAAADKAAPANIQQVQWRHYGGYRGGYYRRGWYGGYRGYPGYRHGYRYYDGYWFPLGGFRRRSHHRWRNCQPAALRRPGSGRRHQSAPYRMVRIALSVLPGL